MFSDYNYGFESGWGMLSNANEAGEQLRLAEKLENVPRGGVVADIGSGYGLSLTSYMFTRRTDLTIISVDPGYKQRDRFDLKRIVENFDDPCRALLLRNNHKWFKRLVTAYSEELPIASESVDLAVSYAVVPEHVMNPVMALGEVMRTLKPSGEFVFGPISEYRSEDLDSYLDKVAAQPNVAGYSFRTDEMKDAYGNDIDVYFAALKKAP